MKGIKLNTEQECTDLINEINEKFSFLFDEITTSYTHFVKHLTLENDYVVIIDKEKISYLAAQFPELFNSLPYGLDDIIELDKEDYFNQDIEI